MHSKTPRAILSLTLLTVSGVIVAACGGSSTSADSKANATDKAFVAQMIPHHQMAVQMAQSAKKRGGHTATTMLAADIVSAQDAEIAQMRTLAKSVGVKPAAMPSGSMSGMDGAMSSDAKALGLSMKEMGMSMDMAMLDNAKPFDRAFIDMMIPHHQGAIRMARAELAKGKDAQLKKIATGIVAAQTKEIGQMNTWRKGWYGAPSPAGGVPAA